MKKKQQAKRAARNILDIWNCKFKGLEGRDYVYVEFLGPRTGALSSMR